MKKTLSVICVLAITLGIAATVSAADQTETTTANQEPACCFENPRFSGTCTVNPSADETCSSILGYLNNQNSVGKTYCGNTKVRGGWTQVSCEGAASMTEALQCTAPAPHE